MDHFYQLPMLGPPDDYMLECYTTLGALARRDGNGAARRAGHRQHVPQPGAAGQDRHRARHRVRRAGPARHRRRLVRVRARLARLRVRHVHRPVREARGGAADHPPDAARRAADARRQALPRSKDAINQPPPVVAHPGDDRRQRREEDAADGRPVRRRVEPHVAVRRAPPQARRARRALRAARPRPRARSR